MVLQADNKGLLNILETYVIRSKILWKANNMIVRMKTAVDNVDKLDDQY
jgi:hypothetical protein